jgi:hypothetical protein
MPRSQSQKNTIDAIPQRDWNVRWVRPKSIYRTVFKSWFLVWPCFRTWAARDKREVFRSLILPDLRSLAQVNYFICDSHFVDWISVHHNQVNSTFSMTDERVTIDNLTLDRMSVISPNPIIKFPPFQAILRDAIDRLLEFIPNSSTQTIDQRLFLTVRLALPQVRKAE